MTTTHKKPYCTKTLLPTRRAPLLEDHLLFPARHHSALQKSADWQKQQFFGCPGGCVVCYRAGAKNVGGEEEVVWRGHD